MKPSISFTVWFSQRNGSSLLCEGLTSTGVAGKPGEHFHIPANTSLLDFYRARDYEELQQKIWQKGMTANGVFGVKVNAPAKENDPIIQSLAQFPGLDAPDPTNFEVWENAFPNGKHIFLTRRNKVKQAVSWWKAIVTEEWHRESGKVCPYAKPDIKEQYNFEAIRHLLIESAFLESKIQAFLDEGNIIPLTIVYEDFIKAYEQTIRSIVAFLGVTETTYAVAKPHYEQLADEISEEWTERFRIEMQKDWKHKKW